jgi:putative hydrolase of the HAD superfamily
LKKAIIVDLDNTIYLVSFIGDRLFKTLFQRIAESGDYKGDWDQVKSEIMRTPFQKVADAFSFGARLKTEGIKLLEEIEYNDSMEPVESYNFIRELPCKKFLVTTGFTKMQNSKIRQLKLEKDFDKIFVIDPGLTTLTKKDIFEKILSDNGYSANDVLVVGDDINSEIKAARELGIDSVVYDFNLEHTDNKELNIITNFKELEAYI